MQLQEQTEKEMKGASEQMSFRIDAYVKLRIRPKPIRLPTFIHKWILKELLVLDLLENNLLPTTTNEA